MLTAAILLLAVADGPKLTAPTVINQLPRESVRRICPRVTHRFDGCTSFRQWALSARCTAKGSRWKMDVTASYNAVVYLMDLTAMSHERLHVRDVQADVGDHMRGLERRTFRSEGACLAAARSAEGSFERDFRQIVRRSQIKRD